MDPFSRMIPQAGELLEQGKQAVSDTAKTAALDTVNTVGGQIGIKNESNVNSSSNPLSQILGSPQVSKQDGMQNIDNINLQNEQTQEMVKDYYAPSSNVSGQETPKTQEEAQTQARLVKLRQELHQQVYYDPLFAFEQQKKESPADIREKEEEQNKMMEIEQKKQDKKLPIAVLRAQTSVEINRGASG